MSCSGTCFGVVDADEVWSALGRLPPGAEDALQACRAGAALCFQGEPGVFVIGLEPGENAGTLEAFVLLAVAATHGAFEIAEPSVLAVARDLGATTVAFRSVRRGWARKLGSAWKPRGRREFWRYVDERQGRKREGDAAAACDG